MVESLANARIFKVSINGRKDLGTLPKNPLKPRENEKILSSWKGIFSRGLAVSLRVMIDEFGMGLVNGDGKSSSGYIDKVHNWLVVEPTHSKNMLVKLDHFPK